MKTAAYLHGLHLIAGFTSLITAVNGLLPVML
jgi:hypothetical protein